MYRDLKLILYKRKEEYLSNMSPSLLINLRGCEVTPEVTLAQNKFNIKLEVPPELGTGANSEVWIRCDDVSTNNFIYNKIKYASKEYNKFKNLIEIQTLVKNQRIT